MSVDFREIPECVWELFDEIMWADNRDRPAKCRDRASAFSIAWGWNPPLIEPGSESFLTMYGLAANSWHKEQLKGDTTLYERVLAVLTPHQSRLMEVLWKKKTMSYVALRSVPHAWNDSPTDEAISKKLKEMRTRLYKCGLSVVSILVSEAKRRVTIERPAD